MSALTDFYLPANRQMPLRWVSGTSYGLDADVWSPTDGQLYRRIVAGAGTTDPAADATNWKLIGGAIKSVQRVSIVMVTWSGAQSASISAVDTAKSRIDIVGRNLTATSYNPAEHDVIPSFLSSTSVQVARGGGAAVNVTYALQITEYR